MLRLQGIFKIMSKKQKYIITAITVFLLLIFISLTIQWRQTKQIKQLVHELSSSNSTIRERAIGALEQLGMPTVPVLLDALKDAEGEARIYIIQLLGNSGSKDVALKLAQMLKDSDWRIKFFIAQSLGRIGTKNVLDLVFEAWHNEKTWQTSQQLTVALSNIGYEEKMPALINIFKNNGDLHKKALCAVLLYEITEENIYREFIIEMAKSKDTVTKNKILFALKFIKSPKTVSLLNTEFDNFDKETQEVILKSQKK